MGYFYIRVPKLFSLKKTSYTYVVNQDGDLAFVRSTNFIVGSRVYLPVRFIDLGSTGKLFQFSHFRVVVSTNDGENLEDVVNE